MRLLLPLAAFLGALMLSGCAWFRGRSDAPPATPDTARAVNTNAPVAPDDKFIVTPSAERGGRVARVNSNLRFAVLTFPIGDVPAIDQRLNVYRNGVKVGEVKVTGPQRNENTVADIVVGEAAAGDEVRDK